MARACLAWLILIPLAEATSHQGEAPHPPVNVLPTLTVPLDAATLDMHPGEADAPPLPPPPPPPPLHNAREAWWNSFLPFVPFQYQQAINANPLLLNNPQVQNELVASVIYKFQANIEVIYSRQNLLVEFIVCSCPNATACSHTLPEMKQTKFEWSSLVPQFHIPGVSFFSKPNLSAPDNYLTGVLVAFEAAIKKIQGRERKILEFATCACPAVESCNAIIKPVLVEIFSGDASTAGILPNIFGPVKPWPLGGGLVGSTAVGVVPGAGGLLGGLLPAGGASSGLGGLLGLGNNQQTYGGLGGSLPIGGASSGLGGLLGLGNNQQTYGGLGGSLPTGGASSGLGGLLGLGNNQQTYGGLLSTLFGNRPVNQTGGWVAIGTTDGSKPIIGTFGQGGVNGTYFGTSYGGGKPQASGSILGTTFESGTGGGVSILGTGHPGISIFGSGGSSLVTSLPHRPPVSLSSHGSLDGNFATEGGLSGGLATIIGGSIGNAMGGTGTTGSSEGHTGSSSGHIGSSSGHIGSSSGHIGSSSGHTGSSSGHTGSSSGHIGSSSGYTGSSSGHIGSSSGHAENASVDVEGSASTSGHFGSSSSLSGGSSIQR